jgi:diguanylate cyclase
METIAAIPTPYLLLALAAMIALGGLLVLGVVVGKRLRLARISSSNPAAGQKNQEPGSSTQTLLAKTLQLNARLEQRISEVESRLHEHSENITDFMTEARTDGLTGLPNRRAIDDELSRRMTAWRHEQKPLFVALLDVDFFKKFNDRYGHLAGDAVLSAVARSLAHSARDGDMVGRLGGEEFAVLLAVRDTAEAVLAIERMRKVVEKTEAPFEGKLLRVTTSCGLACAGEDSGTSELLKQADLALYAAKADGRNCSYFHDGVRARRITAGISSPPSPSVTESDSDSSRPVVRKAALSTLMAELSRDLRNRLDELTSV